MRALIFALAVLSIAAAKKQSRAQVHDKAMNAYQALDFKQAADLFAKELTMLAPAEHGNRVELEARVRLVLSLFQAGKKNESVTEYKLLREKFPAFRFDEDEVLPETIEFFEKAVPSAPAPKVEATVEPEPPPKVEPKAEPKAEPKQIVVSPDQPRVVVAPKDPAAQAPRWRWYYLTPFGIGQFLAGSPVRGAIFAILNAGLVAANIALYVTFNRMVSVVGNEARAQDVAAATNMQMALDVVFFSMLGSFVAGAIDGALERGP